MYLVRISVAVASFYTTAWICSAFTPVNININSIRLQSKPHTRLLSTENNIATDDDTNVVTDDDTNVVTDDDTNSTTTGLKPCYYKTPYEQWEQRTQLQDLTIGQKLIGQKMTGNTDLLDKAKTGPKIFFECGIGRIDKKGNWQMVSGMMRVTKSYSKPSVVRKKVGRLGGGRAIELYVTRVDLDSCRLEVTNSLDVLHEKQEQQNDKTTVSVSTLKEGQELTGKITQLRPFGCMVDVGANRKGLLHIQKVADLFGKYIDKEEGLEDAGLERGATIKVVVQSNEKRRLFLDFTQETKDIAMKEAAELKKQEEEEEKEKEREKLEEEEQQKKEAEQKAAEEEGGGSSNNYEVSEDEAAMWAAYGDDGDDDYDEDEDIEDKLGLGSY